MLHQLEVIKQMSISITLNVQLKKLNKTCLPEACATQTNMCDLFEVWHSCDLRNSCADLFIGYPAFVMLL